MISILSTKVVSDRTQLCLREWKYVVALMKMVKSRKTTSGEEILLQKLLENAFIAFQNTAAFFDFSTVDEPNAAADLRVAVSNLAIAIETANRMVGGKKAILFDAESLAKRYGIDARSVRRKFKQNAVLVDGIRILFDPHWTHSTKNSVIQKRWGRARPNSNNK